jgi:glutamate racemase
MDSELTTNSSSAAALAPDKGADKIEPGLRTPIVGVFDSGIGGFTVAQAVLELRPDLGLVYFGDTLNMPYGGRSLAQLSRLARNNIEFLLSQDIDILAVGCNAAVHSGYWERKLKEALPGVEVIARAAPDFVPLVEAHVQDDAANRAAVRRIIGPLSADGIEHIVHGCTHYPLLEPYMLEIKAEFVLIYPAKCLARKLTASLAPPQPDTVQGTLKLFSSLPGEAFYRTAERVFQCDVRQITKMYIVNPYEE